MESVLTPKDFRLLCRTQAHTGQTSGQCNGYVQANLVILPAKYANDFKKFCELNPKPCPLLEMTEVPGQVECPKFCPSGLDIRTDLPSYKVYKNGVFVEERKDITELWQEDFVTFLIGCSFSFEESLLKSGIGVRHVEEKRNVPIYKILTSIIPLKMEQNVQDKYRLYAKWYIPWQHGGINETIKNKN